MDAKTISLIKALSDAQGASGFEDEAVSVIREAGAGLGQFEEDAMRNLYLRSNEKKDLPTVLLDAHTDEVGFMVRAIKPEGTLEFITLGGWNPANLSGAPVRVRNARGAWLPGVIASVPPHYQSATEQKLPPDIEKMSIDVGALSLEEARDTLEIKIGAPVVPFAPFEHWAERGLLCGKAFDDRLGCAAILKVLEKLTGKSLNVNIVSTFSVQEEVGLRGAQAIFDRVTPDVAICFEGSPADDTFSPQYRIQTALKKGPMLRHIDAKMITNPRFQSFALSTAEKAGLPVQEGVRTGGATNAGAIHLSRRAVPVIVLGIPVRYAHTHRGLASTSDFDNTVELGAAIIEALNKEVIAGF